MKFFKKLRKRFDDWMAPGNRDYEFDAEFEDHPIGKGDIYRLYYVNYHRIQEYPGRADDNIGVINWHGKPFKMPAGMSREDGFKVLSYLTDFIEKRPEVKECSLKSVSTLEGVLDLERFGFTRESTTNRDVIDLFTVDGRLLLFKKMSKCYKDYFNWYVKGVTRGEVVRIYRKCGFEFSDIVWRD